MSTTSPTSTPTEMVTCPCGNGPFFFVETREHPELCLDCGEHADRMEHGWTPENSTN